MSDERKRFERWAARYFVETLATDDCAKRDEEGSYVYSEVQAAYDSWQARAALEANAPRPDPITEEWLKSVGFKWHQFDRQPGKQWLLWCGIRSADNWGVDTQDIGVELTDNVPSRKDWFCWVRSDCSHRYSRFLHVRHLKTQAEVIQLVEAVTGLPWNPANHIYGAVHTDEQAAHIRAEQKRLDRVMLANRPKWREIEKDDTRGGALPEHMEVAEGFEKARGAEPPEAGEEKK